MYEIPFVTNHAFDRQTDGHTDRQLSSGETALHAMHAARWNPKILRCVADIRFSFIHCRSYSGVVFFTFVVQYRDNVILLTNHGCHLLCNKVFW